MPKKGKKYLKIKVITNKNIEILIFHCYSGVENCSTDK